MTDPREEELTSRLAELGASDVDQWRTERIRARAHAVMRRETNAVSRWLDRLEKIYARTLEPAVVFGVGSAYLLWAVRSVIDLLG